MACTSRVLAALERGRKAATLARYEAGRGKVAKEFRDMARTSPNSGHSGYEDIAQRPRWRTNSSKMKYNSPGTSVLEGGTTVAWRTYANAIACRNAVTRAPTETEG